MTSSSIRTSRLDPLIQLLLIALLAFMPAAFGAVSAWAEAVSYVLGAAIALLLAIRGLAAEAREVRPSLAWVAVVLFIMVAAAQLLPLPMSIVRAISPATAEWKTELLSDLPDADEVLARETLSFYPLETRDELRVVLLATTVFAAVVILYRDPSRIRRLLAAVALIGGAFAALALAQDLTGTNEIYWRVPLDIPAHSGPFANHSHYAQFMNLSLGCALALLLARLADAQHGTSALSLARLAWLAWRTWWLAAIIVIALVTISLSLSRGGMLSMFVAGGVTTLVLLARQRFRQMAGVFVLLALGAMALLLYQGFDRVYARLLEPGLGGRIAMTRNALEIVPEFSTVGVGLGAFEWIYPAFDRMRSLSTAEYVENEYAQTLIDTGPLGLAAVLLFVAVIGVRYLRALRRHDQARIGLAAVGLGYGLIAVMVHSLTDFGQHLPAIACLSAVVCGLLFNLGQRPDGWRFRVGRGAAVAMLIVVAAAVTWSVVGAGRAWLAERRWERAEDLAWALEEKDWSASDQEFAALLDAASKAIAAEPGNAYYRYWAAIYRWYWVSSHLDEETGDPLVNEQTVGGALHVVAQLNRARAICPTFGLIYTMLGQVESKFLDRPVGYDHVQVGYRLSRNDADAAFAAGQADARRGHFDEAARKFNEAVSLDWNLAQDIVDEYLYHLNRPELANEAIGPNVGALVRLRDELRKHPEWQHLADEVEKRGFELMEAECQLPGVAAWKLGVVAEYRANLGQHELAERYLTRALQAEPNNVDWRVRRADALHKLGRIGEAVADAKIALRIDPDAPRAKELMARLTGADKNP